MSRLVAFAKQDARSEALSGSSRPILVPVAHPDNEDISAFLDSIYDEMRLERMNTHRRQQLKPLPGYSRIIRQKLETGFEFFVIGLGLRIPEAAHTLDVDAHNVSASRDSR